MNFQWMYGSICTQQVRVTIGGGFGEVIWTLYSLSLESDPSRTLHSAFLGVKYAIFCITFALLKYPALMWRPKGILYPVVRLTR